MAKIKQKQPVLTPKRPIFRIFGLFFMRPPPACFDPDFHIFPPFEPDFVNF
jgi:hypothetical protein